MQNFDKKQCELLAPAGNFDSLKQAVYHGADAVYLGYGSFNARVKADNFDNLKSVVDFCHLYNVKCYLALNISFYDDELTKVEDVIKDAVIANIDAFIITDLALIEIVRRYSKTVEMHASTQLGTHNKYGAQFLKSLGFSRVILSREATFDDIKDIIENVDIDIEVFIHGALCIGFSGGCLFSSILSCESGNRGRCNQLCRHNFDGVTNNKVLTSGYLLSAKDLNLSDKIYDLIKIGVKSFKIEGRLRRPEYVGGTVQIYRKIIDNKILTNNEKRDNDESLKKLFNRGNYTFGYNNGGNKDIVFTAIPSHIGLKIGVIKNFNTSYIDVETESKIFENDGFKILRNFTEVGSAIGGKAIKTKSGYQLKYSGVIKLGDTLHITNDSKLGDEILSNIKKIPVDIHVTANAFEELSITICTSEHMIVCKGDIVNMAQTKALSHEDVVKQISKTGDTEFVVNKIDVITNNAFVPVSKLNELRRTAFQMLCNKILSEYKSTECLDTLAVNDEIVKYNQYIVNGLNKHPKITTNYVEIDNANTIKNIVSELDKAELSKLTFVLKTFDDEIIKEIKMTTSSLIFYKLPIFAGKEDLEVMESNISKFDGIIANNIYGHMLAYKYDKYLVWGANMNITNTQTPIIGLCSNYILSVELNNAKLRNFLNNGVIYMFGRIPLIHLRVCIRQIIDKSLSCQNCKEQNYFLADKKGKYIISTQKTFNCIHSLLNPEITDIDSRENKFYIDVCDINEYDIIKVIKEYVSGSHISNKNSNKGHLNRGAK